MERVPRQGGMGVLIYQVGELKTMLTTITNKVDTFQEKIDIRVADLEKWQAAEIQKDKTKPYIDVQKIILAAFGIVMAAIALIQSKIVH